MSFAQAVPSKSPSAASEGPKAQVVTRPAPAKGVAAVTADEFLTHAETIECVIAGYPAVLEPKVFSSGSYGFGVVGAPPALTAKIAGKAVRLCLSVSLVVANSKPK